MGNMANGGYNRNQCPMCRSAVVQAYDISNEHEEVQQVMQRNQQLAHELERAREYRGQIAAEYMHLVNLNLEIRMRYNQEQEARDALHRRAYAFGLNERIAAVVVNAANNDIRQNYENGAAVHVERQILDLCMSFGMAAYDPEYDRIQIQEDDDEMAE
jgi:small-conductance mechanosensitive channel